MLFNNRTILVERITDEMEQWFLDRFNLDNTKFYTQPHTIRVKYSDGYQDPNIMGGPTHPMGDDFQYNGYEVIFVNKEDAVQFKLTFAEDINKFNPTTYFESW